MRGITGFSVTDVSRISWVTLLWPWGCKTAPGTFALQQKNKPLHAFYFLQKQKIYFL